MPRGGAGADAPSRGSRAQMSPGRMGRAGLRAQLTCPETPLSSPPPFPLGTGLPRAAPRCAVPRGPSRDPSEARPAPLGLWGPHTHCTPLPPPPPAHRWLSCPLGTRGEKPRCQGPGLAPQPLGLGGACGPLPRHGCRASGRSAREVRPPTPGGK